MATSGTHDRLTFGTYEVLNVDGATQDQPDAWARHDSPHPIPRIPPAEHRTATFWLTFAPYTRANLNENAR